MLYLFFFLFLALATGSHYESSNSDGCGLEIPDQPENGYSYRFYVQVEDPLMGSVEREYLLHLPTYYKTSNDVPVPLILDYHGWTSNAANQEFKGSLNDVADEEMEDTFIIVHLEGAGVDDNGGNVSGKGGLGSWNCSRTDGIYGSPCTVPRPFGQDITCYSSCGSCDPELSCDWTACYDDIEFTRAVIKDVSKKYCIDLDSVHMTGLSNGGMFPYFAASDLSDVLATIAPVSGSPLLGFNNIPKKPISIIDFHGTDDPIIPYDLNSIHSIGVGPRLTTTTVDYYYYPGKPRVILDWVYSYNCSTPKQKYPTSMDGINEWTCSKWSGCRNGAEIVHCNGNYGHNYPFEYELEPYIGGTRILWSFMKSHRRNQLV